MFFTKKPELSTDYVELSIGRVDYAKLTGGILNECLRRSTVIKDVLNNAVLLDEVEKRVVVLNKKQRQALSPEDFLKLREKTVSILVRYGILKEAKTAPSQDDRSPEDQEWHNAQRAKLQIIMNRNAQAPPRVKA